MLRRWSYLGLSNLGPRFVDALVDFELTNSKHHFTLYTNR